MDRHEPCTHLVLSDMHFGTPESSVNDDEVVEALADVIARDHWSEVIFSGDLLDLNLSTFTKAIEGSRHEGKKLRGFREFMSTIASRASAGQGVDRWVYIPGNHDYAIWNILSTERACVEVLDRGQRMGSVGTPLRSGEWKDGTAFIAGVFPEDERTKVDVVYPDHLIGGVGGILVTHGHYLDWKQTWFNRLTELENADESRSSAIKKIFIETAFYQALAASVSYTPQWRHLIDLLVGPSGLSEWIDGFLSRGTTRDQSIDEDLLDSIEFYVNDFRGYEVAPKNFIFGHTHVQGSAARRSMDIHNAGSFYPGEDCRATYLTIDVSEDGRARSVNLCSIY